MIPRHLTIPFTFVFGIAFTTIFSLILLPPAVREPLCARLPLWSLTTSQHQRKLHLLLPVNARRARESPNFCKTLLSTLVHGYEPIILNWEVDGDAGVMQRMKVSGVYEYLTNLTDEKAESDVVFMMDGLDVWLQLSPTVLIERFEEFDTSKVVIGADKACWPNQWESPACQDVPESPLPKGVYGPDGDQEWNGMPSARPRWANSGTVIGSVAAMRSLYKDLSDVIHDPARQDATGSDQVVFNEFLASRRLTLDYRSRLFWATAFASPSTTAHFLNTPYHIDPLVPHDLYPPMLHLQQTGEVPVAIHFNGHMDKGLMDEWWGVLWWNRQKGDDDRFTDIVLSRVEDAVVRFAGGGRTSWRGICPEGINGV